VICCVHARAALASHTKLGQQLAALLALSQPQTSAPESPPASPDGPTSNFGNPLFGEERWETTTGEHEESAPAYCISPTSKQRVPLKLQGEVKQQGWRGGGGGGGGVGV
jgi:hypothetical protein